MLATLSYSKRMSKGDKRRQVAIVHTVYCRWALGGNAGDGRGTGPAAFSDKFYSRTVYDTVFLSYAAAANAFLRFPSDYHRLVPGGDASRLLGCCLT